MAFAVKPRAWEVEWRTWPVHETQDIFIEANGVAEVAGRNIVVVEHTDAHAHFVSPF